MGGLAGTGLGLDPTGLAPDGGHRSRPGCALHVQYQRPTQPGRRQHYSGLCKCWAPKHCHHLLKSRVGIQHDGLLRSAGEARGHVEPTAADVKVTLTV
jgi:hypothetical protein